MMIKCTKHQDNEWSGRIVCNDCGSVYQTSDNDAADFAPERCQCGTQLMPTDAKQEFSARAVCESCWLDTIRQIKSVTISVKYNSGHAEIYQFARADKIKKIVQEDRGVVGNALRRVRTDNKLD